MPTNFAKLVSKQFDPNNLQIFFHMPKTAGNSISEMLGTIYGDKYRKASPKEVLDMVEHGTIGSYRALLGHYRLCDVFYERLKININQYVVIREPVDRVISQYYFLRGREDHALHQKALTYSLEDILRSDDMIYEMGMSDFQTQVLSSFLRSGNRKLMFAYAKARLTDAFTFFSLYEELPTLIKVCSDRLGWPEMDLPVLNVSQNRPSKEELPTNTLKMIEDRNQLDIRLYQYATEVYREQMNKYRELFQVEEVVMPTEPDVILVVDAKETQIPKTVVIKESKKKKWFGFPRLRRWFKSVFGKGESEEKTESGVEE